MPRRATGVRMFVAGERMFVPPSRQGPVESAQPVTRDGGTRRRRVRAGGAVLWRCF